MRRPPTLAEVDAELARRSLAEFGSLAWHIIEPGQPFVRTWHTDAMCDHLEAAARGQILKLLITVPPRSSKTIFASDMFPAWVWTWAPHVRWFMSSYALSLSIDSGVRTRRIIESDWYQERWPEVVLQDDRNAKLAYENTKGGWRIAGAVDAATTGKGGDINVLDDPHNVKETESEVQRKATVQWMKTAWYNRLNNPKTGVRIVIQQRVHEEDVAGVLMSEGGWEHLNLPMEFDSERRCVTYFKRSPEMEREEFWRDPRATEGELLCPDRFGPTEVAEYKVKLGSYAYAAQYEQRPVPAAGGLFQRSWWRYWRRPDENDVPGLEDRTVVLDYDTQFDQVLISVDATFKDTSKSDFVSIGSWGIKGPRKYLLNHRWGRMGYIRTKAEIREAKDALPRHHDAVLIEDKANGTAVIEELRQEVDSVIAIEPDGGKEARAQATSPTVEAGDVFLHLHDPRRQDYIDQHAAFPKGAHDDAVDMQSQLLNWLKKGGSVVILVG